MTSKNMRERGSALVTVFWLIAILGMVIFGSAKFVSLDALWITGLRKTAIAANYAESGLAIASHPQVKPGDPILLRDLEENGGFVAEITTEEGLIPINLILEGQQKPIVKRLLRLWGMDEREAAALTDALSDWVDADDLVGLNGAEFDAYTAMGRPGFPLNRPFDSIDEMRNVRGMERLDQLNPEWPGSFTVHSSGQFDLNAATADLISAVTGIPIESVRTKVAQRDGLDGMSGTRDDVPFKSVDAALQSLGFTSGAGVDFFTTAGRTRRIMCVGFFGDVRHQAVEVLDAGGNRLWRGRIKTKISDGRD